VTDPLAMSDRFKQVSDLEITRMPDGYVVYRPESDRVLFLNATAAVTFELCDGQQSLADIQELLVAAYELDQFPTDEFRSCVNQLLVEGLIVPCTS
jgi:hypothetical protein